MPSFPALPYFPEQARPALAGIASLDLAGACEPVAFFAYPGPSSRFAPPDAILQSLTDPDEGLDETLALEAVANELNAPSLPQQRRDSEALTPGDQPLNGDNLTCVLAAFTPENAIVVNEAATTGLIENAVHAANAAPHTMFSLTGGVIGQGLPDALGAALACPDRRVIAFQADGSGLYTVQAMWSIARENVNVAVVVAANRSYKVLQVELARAGVMQPGPKAQSLVDLTRPVIDLLALVKGFGVPGCSAHR